MKEIKDEDEHQKAKEINLRKIREMTKPVLGDLKANISDIRGIAPSFGYPPISFSEKSGSSWSFISKDILGSKGTQNLYMKKLLQNYDIESFKQK